MKQTVSGSPAAQNLRRKAYREQSGRVSNPGQPSPTNRQARRAQVTLTEAVEDWTAHAPLDPRD